MKIIQNFLRLAVRSRLSPYWPKLVARIPPGKTASILNLYCDNLHELNAYFFMGKSLGFSLRMCSQLIGYNNCRCNCNYKYIIVITIAVIIIIIIVILIRVIITIMLNFNSRKKISLLLHEIKRNKKIEKN